MNTPVCILGTGSSGLAAARLLAGQGIRGTVCADREPDGACLRAFADLGFSWTPAPPPGAGTRIVSPGFPAEHPFLRDSADFLAEFELGTRSLRGKTLAVTGSLGKTTLVMLAAEILRAHGLRVTLSGNIGTPVCETALQSPDANVHVLELSSFQTEINRNFRPDIGILLNLVPNHLDRHGSFERYAEAKLRLFAAQGPGDAAILPSPWNERVQTAARVSQPDTAHLPDLRETRFDTPPLRANLAALFTALRDFELDPVRVRRCLEAFAFPPHRMHEQFLPGVGRVIDDSKSTCLTATRAALQSVPGPVCLFVGGMGKGEDPAILAGELSRGGVKLFLFGRDAPLFARAWEGLPELCRLHARLEEAVADAFLHRHANEPLLFSPGCASFDQYSGYSARGEHFLRLVRPPIPEFEPVGLSCCKEKP